MKSTGVMRKVDDLGRIVLPSELRKVLGIQEGDHLDISVDGERIILEKRRDACLFCCAEGPEIEHRGRKVCALCAEALSRSSRIEITLPTEAPVTT